MSCYIMIHHVLHIYNNNLYQKHVTLYVTRHVSLHVTAVHVYVTFFTCYMYHVTYPRLKRGVLHVRHVANKRYYM
jgi:hypothetical protein